MTAHLITFCDSSMTRAADLCASSAREHGADQALIYPQSSLELTAFYQENQTLLDQPRGAGYFAWKPFVISEEMRELCDGDILIYSDSGVAFINNLNYVIDRMDQDIWLYGNEWPHYMWCKRDIIEAIWPERKADFNNFVGESGSNRNLWASFGNQVQASVIFFRVNDHTRAFVREWLDWCLTGARIGAAMSFGKDNPEHRDARMTWSEFRYLIDDSPSVFPNHPDFRENRHDQAILATMAYRNGIKLHPWNVKYLTFEPARREGYPEDADIPVLYLHHRRRNPEF